jgi:hypothetical protein
MRRPTLAVFVLFQALYVLTASGWVFRIPDEYEVYLQTESLVDRQSLAIPQVRELGGGKAFFGKKSGDLLYAPYGPLAAALAVPHHLAARAAAAGIRGADPRAWRIFVAALTSLATGTAGALAVAGFVAAALALGASPRRATALAIALGLGTVLWPYATSFFSEAFSAAAFIWATAFLLEARLPPPLAGEGRGGGRVGLAALLLAVAVLTKATNLVYAVPIALAPLLAGRRNATGVLLGAVAAAVLIHMQWNTHRFGSPLDFGYDWTETITGEPRPFGGDLARGLVVLLVSPGKSLFLWAPVLLLAATRVRALDRPVALTLAFLLAAGLLVFGSYMFVEGGYCHGPRHLVPIVPLLLLPAAVGRAPSRFALALTFVLGAALNGLAVSTSYLEDQAWGEDRSRAVYYERDPSPKPGLPQNRYRLGYTPELTLPALLATSLGKISRGEAELPGTGLNLLPLNLERAGFQRVGILPVIDLTALLALVLAALGLRTTLLRKENAAILRP